MTTNESNHACPKCGALIPTDAPHGLCPRCVLAGAAAPADSGPSARAATATSEIPSLERLRTEFPHLEILELIGRGGMGFVFKGRQPHLDRWVALKLLPDKLARDPQFAERFNREGRVLARLNHSNIVSVFDFGRTEHFYFLIMEFVDGVNLRQAMQAGRFSPAEALAIVPKICEALQYAHDQGVLHRDIKPENILLDAKGRVKIADFGIAKLVEDKPDSTLTGTGAALGTPHYMAPEQLEKPSDVDHRADIYSLGVVFYELLTGELPIGRFAPPSARTPVGVAVDEVVFRTLEKDREKRFQSAGEMKTEVEHLTESGAATNPARGSSDGPTGPHGTVVVASSEKPTYAFRAFAGAAMVGASLVKPLSVVVSLLTGRGEVSPRDLGLALGSVALPGLGGTLVGWLALNEIRDSRGTVRGLPFALFASLLWPLLGLLAATVGLPMSMLASSVESSWVQVLGRVLVLLLPAGVLTFGLWSVHATALWATGNGRSAMGRRRGVLKWVFIGVLVAGLGLVLLPATLRRLPASAPPEAEAAGPAVAIRFTFTAAELRNDGGTRWLTMDYVEQVRGDCERYFRYDANVPGFTPATRTQASRTSATPGFAPVLHQRVSWRLPDNMTEPEAVVLRDLVAREWIGKGVTLEPGDERVLFKSPVPDGGTLAAFFGTRLNRPVPSSSPTPTRSAAP